MMLLWWVWTLLCISMVIVGGVRLLASAKRLLPIALLMIGLRLLYLPLDSQAVVGHSVQYLEVFHGKVPTIGDSTFYPALQIIWFLFGKIALGFIDPRVLSATLGVISIWWLTVPTPSNEPLRGSQINWLPMIWLFMLPAHIFWSHSMYNVVFPFALLSLSIRLAQTKRWYLLSAAMALAVSCRMETVLFWGMLLFFLPIWDWRVLLQAGLGTIISLLLLSSMQVPGDGEYWDSIAHNWWLITYYLPYIVALFGILMVLRKKHLPLFGWGVLWLVGHHAILSTFNDFSSRHILVVAIVLVILWSEVLGEQSRKWARYPLVAAIIFNGYTLWAQRAQLQFDEVAFQQFIQTKASTSAPDLTLQQAQSRGCAWIVEVEPIALHPRQPVRSHFNLLNPLEVRGLLMEYGCIDWCYTIQDWGWTELGVQDRAVRIEQMYEWSSIATVREGDTACLLRSMVTDFEPEHFDHDHVH